MLDSLLRGWWRCACSSQLHHSLWAGRCLGKRTRLSCLTCRLRAGPLWRRELVRTQRWLVAQTAAQLPPRSGCNTLAARRLIWGKAGIDIIWTAAGLWAFTVLPETGASCRCYYSRTADRSCLFQWSVSPNWRSELGSLIVSGRLVYQAMDRSAWYDGVGC